MLVSLFTFKQSEDFQIMLELQVILGKMRKLIAVVLERKCKFLTQNVNHHQQNKLLCNAKQNDEDVVKVQQPAILPRKSEEAI